MMNDAAFAVPDGAGEACTPISASEQIEFCYGRGWTDGLPVIPPTRPLVKEMLEGGRLSCDSVIATMPSRKVSVTAEKVAVNAVMAGCKPQYMPVVVAAVKALAAPEFGLHHVAAALGGPTIIVLVNGPIARKIGVNAGNNLFGPGVRANATIGRALRLVVLNCLRYRPGISDRSTLGTPGKYTCCIAENEDDHPWMPWHVERGFKPGDSTVTLMASGSMMQVWNKRADPHRLLLSLGDAFAFLGSRPLIRQTPGTVVLAGEHAELFRAQGWSKQQVREGIAAHTGRKVADLKRVGWIDGDITPEDETTMHYAVSPPEDLMLLCGGGPIGPISMVLTGFSETSGRSRPILVEAPPQ